MRRILAWLGQLHQLAWDTYDAIAVRLVRIPDDVWPSEADQQLARDLIDRTAHLRTPQEPS